MPTTDSGMRTLVDALEEPALIVEGLSVSFANDGAKAVLGPAIEGRDIRLAIRHPGALEYILSGRRADVDVTGIGEVGRPWRVVVRDLGGGASFVRLIDRSRTVSAEKMRVDFVANASHELRTPLSTIMGYAETLADDGLVDDAKLRGSFAQTIRDEAARMLRIIEDLMSLSRIQADRFLIPNESLGLEEVISAAVANVTPITKGKCRIEVQVAEGLPKVLGDRGQLVQVVDNLLSNAIRYGCDRADALVTISAAPAGRWVVLTVADQGPGIARQHIPRLTERFYRVDEARSRGSGGTGLGLAIVKHIVERHRGRLKIDSAVGEGTRVTVHLRTHEEFSR